MPIKDKLGLGFHDLEVKKRALLGKRLFKLLAKEGIWQILLRRKFVASHVLSHVYWRPSDSHSLGWSYGDKKILLPIWDLFLQKFTFVATMMQSKNNIVAVSQKIGEGFSKDGRDSIHLLNLSLIMVFMNM
jgi:hypothetical protein